MGTSQYENLCRICTIEQIEGIFIFSEEGKRLFLEAKIKKYLYIVVSPDDSLPTLVCRSCARRLDSVHQFASQALEAQERLQLTIGTEPGTPENGRDTVSNGNKEQSGPHVVDGVTEVEVRVDPMSFLCLLEDAEESPPAPSSEPCEVADGLGGMFRLACASCSGLRFATFAQLDSHCRGTHGTRGVAQCRECGQQVSRRSRIAAHRRHHRGDCALYSCDVCGKGFSLRCLLKRHREGHVLPDEEQPFLCSVCPRGFESDVSLRNHLWGHFPRGRHLMLNPEECQRFDESIEAQACFVCPLCGKILSTKGNLKVHLETHRPKGKYGCDICGRIFKTQSNLYRHKEYHKGKQFPCPECGRVYPTRSTLRAHSITHSDLRPHGCPYCEKTFKRNQDLKFHLNQHTGARPYKCPYCPKAFASSGNCFSHRKRMHCKEVERDREHLQ